MLKKIKTIVLTVFFIYSTSNQIALARTVAQDPEKMAKDIHTRANSDIIYQDEEIKALYYQNIQIISLLRDIKGLMEQSLEEKEIE
ncbi:MAG: hypothetical protein ABIB11_04035 [Candidatus Omnitrophota bacterium]